MKHENKQLFFLKKKAEPEIDVAILKKIQLVVRLKCNARIQYMYANLVFNSKLNNRFACTICYRSPNTILYRNKRYDKWQH